MRISDDLRKCVVFIGIDDNLQVGGIKCAGTGFFILYDEYQYLVTSQHIAFQIGDAPFLIRFNRSDGTSQNISVDAMMPIKRKIWFYNHDDPTVDLAVMPLHFNPAAVNFDMLNIPQDMFLTKKRFYSEDVGIGDICYTIGLFRLLSGNKRNLPIVHTGNIALLPGDEKVPVKDWLKPFETNARVYVECFLIESQALSGLSGSPVFVRPCVDMTDLQTTLGKKLDVRLAKSHPFLLGIWQGSWDAKPDEVAAVEHGDPARVPVGIGVVVPVTKLIDVLEMPELVDLRNQRRKERAYVDAATPD